MEPEILAYLAGAMDSDGCFVVKKSTYHARQNKGTTNPTYSELLQLQQVTPQIPELLKTTFGGTICHCASAGPNRKPLIRWGCTEIKAAAARQALLPYLRIKKRQAKLLLELRETKNPKYRQETYWFALEYPNWPELELVTYSEARMLLGHSDPQSISQAVLQGTLLATPYHRGYRELPRIPRLLIERMLSRPSRDGRSRRRPEALIRWREAICQQVRELNKTGIHGTSIYHRTGPHHLK